MLHRSTADQTLFLTAFTSPIMVQVLQFSTENAALKNQNPLAKHQVVAYYSCTNNAVYGDSFLDSVTLVW